MCAQCMGQICVQYCHHGDCLTYIRIVSLQAPKLGVVNGACQTNTTPSSSGGWFLGYFTSWAMPTSSSSLL